MIMEEREASLGSEMVSELEEAASPVELKYVEYEPGSIAAVLRERLEKNKKLD